MYQNPKLIAQYGLILILTWISSFEVATSSARAADNPGPSHPAVNDPDKFAWQIFARINKQANNGTNDVEWETWASDEDTFPSAPSLANPPTWPGAQKRAKTLRPSRQLRMANEMRARLSAGSGHPRILAGGRQEVRRNRPAFDFVVDRGLWHLDGLIDTFRRGESISFPIESIEIKADWKPITEADKPRYHWNVDGSGALFGLIALHITTKDLPNWFWATFEHVDNPNRGRVLGAHDSFGTTPANDIAGAPSASLLTLFTEAGLDAKWQYYRLDDTQVDFTDSTGRPTIVGNSITEDGFVSTSSCITCHARSAFDATGEFLSFFKSFSPLEGNVGVPDPAWFYNSNGTRKTMQGDFVWAFAFASPLPSGPGPTPPTAGIAPAAITPAPIPARAAGRGLTRSAQAAPGDLSRMETRTVARSRKSGLELSEKVIQNSAWAAHLYAEALAGSDNQRYVESFREALNLSVEQEALRQRLKNAPQSALMMLSPVPDAGSVILNPVPLSPNSIFSDPKYLANARLLGQASRQRIVGGVATTDFPDCVAVGSSTDWCCTGTLVAKNVVVTAGHCASSCASRVYIGNNVNSPGRIIQATAYQHPDYGQNGLHNDLTVLILHEDVTEFAPRGVASDSDIAASFFVRAAGFGNTDVFGSTGYGIKRMVDVPIASHDGTDAGAQARYGCDPGLELVAGAPFLNRDTCNGDSGGPIYVSVSGQWLLAGATSRATGDSVQNCGDGGIYCRVDKYLTWIKSVPGGHW